MGELTNSKVLFNGEGIDTDQTVFIPDSDPTTTTDPGNKDTDGDGLDDGEEDSNKNGRVDQAESDPNDKQSGPEINVNLKKGFNLVSFPSGVSNTPDLKDWLSIIGDSATIEKVMAYNLETGGCITLIPGGETNPSFTLNNGDAVIIYALKDHTVRFDGVDCSPVELADGLNLVGFPCQPDNYSAFNLLTKIGSQNVINIQRYNSSTGAFETAGFDRNAQLIGIDFKILSGEGYFINMKQTLNGFIP